MNTLPLAISLAALSTLASASIWETATFQVTCSTYTTAQDASGTLTTTNGGMFSTPLASPLITFLADDELPSGGSASAFSEATHGMTPSNSLFMYGSVWAKVNPTDSMTFARAEAHSAYSIQFEVPGNATYRFPTGFLGWGAVASIHDESGAVIASFDSFNAPPKGKSGFLPAGSYRFEVAADTTRDLLLGLMDRSGTYGLELLITPAACSSDINHDWQVDDFDFTNFVVGYHILDCADPTMPFACPADFNGDAIVDDADFSIFAAAYDALVCP